MQLIITEKYSAAADIASATGAVLDDSKAYFIGGIYYITWLFGHMVEMATEYDQRPWDILELPLLPERFLLEPMHKRDTEGRRLNEPDQRCLNQLKVIKELLARCDVIINAGDCGREGELIQRNVYSFIGNRKPVQRLWISSLTKEEIRRGLYELRPGSDFDNLYASGRARAEADWLVGINATRALTLHSASPMPLSLGRVQTPVLCMIARRYLDNKTFTPQPYWVLRGGSTIKGFDETWRGTKQFRDEQEAKRAYEEVKTSGFLRVEDSKRGEKAVQAPLLHDIASLQKIANKRYGYTAFETLAAAQSLYEKKLISYPRTGSRYIPESMWAVLPEILRNTANNFPDYEGFISPLLDDVDSMNRHCVDDSKVEDHYGIIVTGKGTEGLTLGEAETRVLGLVLSRSIEAFMPPCLYNVATINLSACGGRYLFIMNGSKIAKAGWKEVSGKAFSESDEAEDEAEERIPDGENIYPLPDVADGQLISFYDIGLKQLMTRPQPLYTDASLLTDMENAGKLVEDMQEKAAIRSIGIGTPATRAAEIEILVRRSYIYRNSNKKILPTELGLNVYDAVKDRGIANVDITASWERQLLAIEKGEENIDRFRARIRQYASVLTADILSGAKVALRTYSCPKCNKPMRLSSKAVYCPDCNISVYKSVNGKTLSSLQLADLLSKGCTAEIKGFKKKDGSEFSCALAFDEQYRVVFKSVDHSVERNGNRLLCPCCQTPVFVGEKTISCRDKEGCGWLIFRSYNGKTLTDSQVASLLTKGRTAMIKGFVSRKSGKAFDARLALGEDKKVVFEFENK